VRIAIVGGGAGGIFAAISAAKTARELNANAHVDLFERNPRLGIKIRISGGGKCNITHVGLVDDVLREGFPEKNEERFLRYAMHEYRNSDVLALLERRGVTWHARDNGRVFPDSGRADDVLAAFEQELRSEHIQLHTNARVTNIAREEDHWLIEANGKRHEADGLILATGGTSYKKVGTTGDGLTFAEKLGHTIVPIRAALAPIFLRNAPPQELVGVALRDVQLLIHRNGSTTARYDGDILITHRGLSGPATLGISRAAALEMEQGSIEIAANLLCKNEEGTRSLLLDLQQARSQQQVKTWLEELLPNRFAPYVLEQAEIPQERKWNALTREERNRLIRTLTSYNFGIVSEIPIDRGEVTAGGISLKEVDSKTMRSKLIRNLYFAGEMLDIAGEIGGYNLQAAYSTGWVAGREAAKSCLKAL
jgi:predicted Rossmann fold flavoprotein